eukprot:scaffold2799_cov159-Ochromonas_danica.AAC.31
MFTRLKRFDVHVKSLDGEINVISKLEIDKGVGVEAVKVMFDVSFPKIGCSRITFAQEATRGTVHSHSPMEVIKVDQPRVTPDSSTDGCRISGWGIIDKIAGNFRFVVAKDGDRPGADLSHRINFLSFVSTLGKSAVGKVPNAPTNISDLNIELPGDSAIYQYSMQIIPTQYRELWGDTSYMNQYALSEKHLNVEQASKNDPFFPVPVRDFQGLLFTYDFQPVMVQMEEHREHVVDFLCSLCGIIGGVITILGLFERCLHSSQKALIGKKD